MPMRMHRLLIFSPYRAPIQHARRALLLASSSLPTHRSSSTSSFETDKLFPPPTDDNIHRYGMPLLARAAHHAQMGRTLAYDLYTSKDASVDKDRKIAYSYHDVLRMSTRLHKFFVEQKNKILDNGSPQRVAFLCNPGPKYIAAQFAAWSSGSIAVPLCISHRCSELAYVLKDCDPAFVIDGFSDLSEGRELRMAAREVGLMDRYCCLDDMLAEQQQHLGEQEYALGSGGDIPTQDHPALIIYTSGEVVCLIWLLDGCRKCLMYSAHYLIDDLYRNYWQPKGCSAFSQEHILSNY